MCRHTYLTCLGAQNVHRSFICYYATQICKSSTEITVLRRFTSIPNSLVLPNVSFRKANNLPRAMYPVCFFPNSHFTTHSADGAIFGTMEVSRYFNKADLVAGVRSCRLCEAKERLLDDHEVEVGLTKKAAVRAALEGSQTNLRHSTPTLKRLRSR